VTRIIQAMTGLVVAFLLSGCAGQSLGSADGWYDGQNGTPPRDHRVYICHGFGCTYKTPVDFSARDLGRLKAMLASGKSSPEAERTAVSRAVQWQEKRVAGLVGSGSDRGGYDPQNSRVRGQMDCIDEASNTTSLLLVAQARGYLRHHKVGRPVARGFFLDGRYPHATATLREKRSGKVWAIDSWPRSNGKAPDVMALDLWMLERSG
jgi:hypothetical protein